MRHLLSALLLFGFAVQASGQNLSPQEAKERIQKRGVEFNKSSFVSAAMEGDENLVRLFLQAGLDPDSKFRTAGVGMYVSELALSEGHLDVLEVLLQNGANPNAGSVLERLIHSAVDRPEALEMLITYGARIDAQSSNGTKAVHKAILSDTTAEVRNRSLRILLRSGADPEAKIEGGELEGATPMLLCATKDRPKATRILARSGARVSLEPSGWVGPEGTTIATIARKAGNEETARVMEELME